VLDFAIGLASREPSPEDAAIRADASAHLHCAIERLTTDQRAVIELRCIGIGIGEIARMLSISDGAAKQLQHRAIVRLRMLLADSISGKTDRDA
jgi:RNA polymerase sigma factor (sigma-70 family)